MNNPKVFDKQLTRIEVGDKVQVVASGLVTYGCQFYVGLILNDRRIKLYRDGEMTKFSHYMKSEGVVLVDRAERENEEQVSENLPNFDFKSLFVVSSERRRDNVVNDDCSIFNCKNKEEARLMMKEIEEDFDITEEATYIHNGHKTYRVEFKTTVSEVL